MINPQLLEGLTEQFAQLLSGEGKLPGQASMKLQVKSILQSSLDRFDLVTREEFDAQKAVLQRTREKVDALEATLAKLESSLKDDR